jgi:superoxide dismutase, Cu-Zn family
MWKRISAMVAVLGLAACGNANESMQDRPNDPPPAGTPWMMSSGMPEPDASASAGWPSAGGSGEPPLTEGTASGTFLPAAQGTRAITYDPAVVPPGATAKVTLSTTTSGVRVQLAVSGMVPSRAYGAHLHTKPCTAVADQAGPHFQHLADPKSPSVDPAFANPQNEVWLDFTADNLGNASAASDHVWKFDGGAPRSLIVHAETTQRQAGKAGTAGPRVACLTLRG